MSTNKPLFGPVVLVIVPKVIVEPCHFLPKSVEIHTQCDECYSDIAVGSWRIDGISWVVRSFNHRLVWRHTRQLIYQVAAWWILLSHNAMFCCYCCERMNLNLRPIFSTKTSPLQIWLQRTYFLVPWRQTVGLCAEFVFRATCNHEGQNIIEHNGKQ